YEIAVWIPLIKERFGLENCTAISRGGTDSWYPCPVINAYDYMPPEEYRKLVLKRQRRLSSINPRTDPVKCPTDPVGEEILKRIGVRSALPAWELFSRLNRKAKKYHIEPDAKRLERYPGLPDKYIAVRLYQNTWLTKLPELKEDLPLVYLRPDTDVVDDHPEFDHPGDVVYRVYDSLKVITQVVQHAEEFICSYGGLSWLGAKCGVPTRGLVDNEHLSRNDPDIVANMRYPHFKRIDLSGRGLGDW